MSYEEVVDYLFNQTPVFEHTGASAYKPGLKTSEVLDRHDNFPHQRYKTIHIAGTNGKGSCSHSIASILQCAGYRVGLYTSPHLCDFRERIRVNGTCISKQAVIRYVNSYLKWQKELPEEEQLCPSFFELTTAMAFKFFASQKVDIAVVEVGLGGRLDSTNIITPVISVITNISFDHTQQLGHTLESIAGEKAGIIKHHIPVVIGETTEETRPVFNQKAKEMAAPIVFAEDRNYSIPLPYFELQGDYQVHNLRTIICACDILRNSFHITDDDIAQGLAHVTENTGLQGRWQVIQDKPKVICDTGHNVGGWKFLSRQIAEQKYRHLHIVFGMVDDKDVESVLELLPNTADYYFTQADNHRAIPASKLKSMAKKHHLKGAAYENVSEAYTSAMEKAQADDFIFIGGSTYVVADFLKSLH